MRLVVDPCGPKVDEDDADAIKGTGDGITTPRLAVRMTLTSVTTNNSRVASAGAAGA